MPDTSDDSLPPALRAHDWVLGVQPFRSGPSAERVDAVRRRLGLADVVRLDSNENALGPSAAVAGALAEAARLVHRYPDHEGRALRGELAHATGLDGPAQVLLGQGSTEVVELLVRALVGPGEGVAVSSSAFLGFRLAAAKANARVHLVPPALDRRTDLDALAERVLSPGAGEGPVRMVYVDNPNNPTGTFNTRAELARFLDRVGDRVLTVIDQAYREYVDDPDFPEAAELVRSGAPVLVMGTFSKIHALAGLRLGYGLARSALLEQVERLRPPYNTSLAAQMAGRAALGDREHQEHSRRSNAAERELLAAGLRRLALEPRPAAANFLFFELEDRDPVALADRLLDRGVMIRPTGAYGFPRGVRISVGTREENRRLLEVLAEELP